MSGYNDVFLSVLRLNSFPLFEKEQVLISRLIDYFQKEKVTGKTVLPLNAVFNIILITMVNLTTETVLQVINQKFVTLNTPEVAHNNELLRSVLGVIINIMRNEDFLFKTLYKEIYYGGSYFDDLKVGKPDEFDLDLLLELPKTCQTHKSKTCECIEVVPSNKPGFFWFKIQKDYFEPFNRFIRDGYVQTDLMLSWLQSLVTKALNKMPSLDYSYTTPSYNSQSGPALTLRLYGEFGEVDVDLVPAFKLCAAQWPKMRYRANPSTRKTNFFIVPKKARGINKAERYWRASFQDQERELINQKDRLKPALRLLKKLRTNLGHCSISSYALKTIVLWELNSFDWNKSLSYVFLNLLEKYRDCLNNKSIPYYWNSGGNLLDGIHADTLTNHCNEITKKINRFKINCQTNSTEIAKIILKEHSEEYNLFLDFIQDLEKEDSSTDWCLVSSEEPSATLSQDLQQPSSSISPGWLIAGAVGLAAASLLGISISNSLNKNNK